MFKLERRGFFRRTTRLVADVRLSSADFRRIGDELGTRPFCARKIGHVAAERATAPTRIETRWNGKESVVDVAPGDWIVTNLTPTAAVLRDRDGHANTYAIKPDRFADLYEPDGRQSEFGAVYRAKGVVEALALSGGFDIEAPWGERQQAAAGYLVLNGPDVYGNNKETFEATYEVLP